ncbi:hypothetical protein AB0N73_01495 [Microbacterium sp. NPDC089189]|uniref:DUF6993 domain-containing protein n=1 Tax=Microbacterium sp. NPDC089189 TaxID=3154972 RepID=UPI00343F7291
MTSHRAGRWAVSAVGLTFAAVLIAGCTAPAEPAPSATPTPSETAAVEPAVELVPDGTAEENLPVFRSVVEQVWAGPDQVSGRAYVDALTTIGFDKAAMQVTEDQSTVGNAAESIQFSVRWGEECLVGQVGPATGGTVTTVLPGLPDGGCLLGQTRPIDW